MSIVIATTQAATALGPGLRELHEACNTEDIQKENERARNNNNYYYYYYKTTTSTAAKKTLTIMYYNSEVKRVITNVKQ